MPNAAEGYTIDELAREAGVTPRAIRYWVRREVLPRPKFRASATRYGAEYVARIGALKALQRQGLDLREIRRRLENLAPAEVEQLAASTMAPAKAPDAPPAALHAALVAERWHRVVLIPGLELSLREGMGPAVVKMANEIASQFGKGGGGGS